MSLTAIDRAADAAQTHAAANLSGVAQWAVDIMEAVGAPGAGLAIALENLFPPLPSEVILPLAGFTASRGTFGLAEALLWTTLGSVLGAFVLYGVGALLGRERMRAIAARLPLVDVADVDRTEAWFGRHGAKAVFFGRMVPVFRSLISIPAGIERMPIWKFLLLTTAGSLIWNTIFVLSGFYLGENWHIVERYADVFQKIVIAVVAVAVVVWVLARLARRRNKDKTAL
ncbi:DedA family protein [Arthrobacter sp. GCM10027362]|uniref:DedA family protein n=1 Tax=Arthrobacter sp. GCM10027362 TaxID=3273379 RepID=UPI0036300CD4